MDLLLQVIGAHEMPKGPGADGESVGDGQAQPGLQLAQIRVFVSHRAGVEAAYPIEGDDEIVLHGVRPGSQVVLQILADHLAPLPEHTVAIAPQLDHLLDQSGDPLLDFVEDGHVWQEVSPRLFLNDANGAEHLVVLIQ